MARFKQIWINIKSSFWFIPAIVNITLIIVAVCVIELDHILAASKHPLAIFSFQQESIRTFLATIAGSMMTIAGVVFSITILVLAQTAGQYSSRVLRNFMRKKSNQLILGLFVGIFIFCLFLITNLHPTDNGLTALSGFVLAIIGVGFLIYFIHETSLSIQATEIINNVYDETIEGIENVYPDSYEGKKRDGIGFDISYSIGAGKTGYIQAFDIAALLELAKEFQIQISFLKKIGDFVAKTEDICQVSADLAKDERFILRLNRSISVGRQRSAEQDVAFGVQQIVDIALRGLSSGINDLSTAQTATDYLGSVYIVLANRDLGNTTFCHEEKPILYIPLQTLESYLQMGLQAICANAKGQPTIQNCINQTIEKVKKLTKAPERKALLENYSCPYRPNSE